MTVQVRVFLILLVFFINVCFFLYFKIKKKNLSESCYLFLSLQCLFFPIIDLSTTLLGSCLGMNLIAFILLNFKILFTIPWRKYILALLLFFIMILSAVCSDNIINSLSSIPNKCIGLAIFFITVIAFEKGTNNKIENVNRILKWPLFYIILFGCIQLFFTTEFSLYFSPYSRDFRISTCLRDPQTAGTILATLFMFLWNQFLALKAKFISIISMSLLFLLGCFTGSKSFFLGVVFALITSLLYNKVKPKLLFIIIAVFLVCTIFWEDIYQLPLYQRFLEADESLNYRQEVFWSAAILIFCDNWATGIGPGNFQFYVEENNLPLTHGVDRVFATQPESGWLLWLDEYGIFSILILLLLSKLFLVKQGKIFNISLIIPCLISLISVYSFVSLHIVFVFFMLTATIYLSKHVNNHENNTISI